MAEFGVEITLTSLPVCLAQASAPSWQSLSSRPTAPQEIEIVAAAAGATTAAEVSMPATTSLAAQAQEGADPARVGSRPTLSWPAICRWFPVSASPVVDYGKTSRRLRIAVLFDHLNAFSGGYEARCATGFTRSAARRATTCCSSMGDRSRRRSRRTRRTTPCTNLLRPDSADGIVLVSSLLSTHSGPSGVARLVERLAGATLCSVGIELPGVPSLVLDNRPGMEAVVEHLIRRHGCRKIAFLAGTAENPEATIRFDAYRAVLARHGLACDPALIARGHFRTNSAKVAMEEILARGWTSTASSRRMTRWRPGPWTSCASTAGGCPRTSRSRASTISLARLGNPPLTTVAQPFEQVADWAVRAIEEQLAGRAVPASTQVAARFVRRQSCGCGFEAYRRDTPATPLPLLTDATDHGPVVDRLDALRSVLAGLLGTGFTDGAGAAARLLDALRAVMGGQPEAFQEAIGGLLNNAGTDSERQRMLHSAICYLREELRGWSTCSSSASSSTD